MVSGILSGLSQTEGNYKLAVMSGELIQFNWQKVHSGFIALVKQSQFIFQRHIKIHRGRRAGINYQCIVPVLGMHVFPR